jgi:hypothetical protein
MKMPLKVALIYFILSNIIFIAGAHGKIDAFIWGFLSYAIYWPFSHITGEIWRIVQGTPPSIDNANAIFLGLTASQCLIYSLDVLGGTVWWWALSLFVSKIRARRLSSNGPESL